MNVAMLTGEVVRVDRRGEGPVRLKVKTTKRFTNKQGEAKTFLAYHDVECWFDKDFVAGLNEGATVEVVGSLQSGKYENKDGVTVYTYNLKADKVQLFGEAEQEPKRETGGGYDDSDIPFGRLDGRYDY